MFDRPGYSAKPGRQNFSPSRPQIAAATADRSARAGGGGLIAPGVESGVRNLVLLEKIGKQIKREVICQVLYVSLRGESGAGKV